jgi:hypothetical protein
LSFFVNVPSLFIVGAGSLGLGSRFILSCPIAFKGPTAVAFTFDVSPNLIPILGAKFILGPTTPEGRVDGADGETPLCLDGRFDASVDSTLLPADVPRGVGLTGRRLRPLGAVPLCNELSEEFFLARGACSVRRLNPKDEDELEDEDGRADDPEEATVVSGGLYALIPEEDVRVRLPSDEGPLGGFKARTR